MHWYTYHVPRFVYDATDTIASYCIHTDLDECQNMNSLCEQICHNTNGSYKCRCRSGFELLGNGRSCEGDFF